MIIFILAISGYWLWKSYNVLIVSLENCKAAFSNIDTELARRFDLYIKATAILKNGSEFEKGIYTKVTQLRTRSDLSIYEKVSEVDKLVAVKESNPDVKSIELYRNMQNVVSLTESRIQAARQEYNAEVKGYNTTISQIPMKFAAHILKFDRREYFQYDI